MKASSIADVIIKHTRVTHFIISYSGGIDSTVLLYIMAELQRHYSHWCVSAVHVNHRLQPQADQWQQHCQSVCDAQDIPLTCFEVDLNLQPGDSVEAVARQKRYEQIATLMSEQHCLLTGHNQNDQVETFLLQLMRGSGLKGLAAMPVSKPYAAGCCIRPLLSVTRKKIEQYAHEKKLHWIEDHSNQDLRFDRNFLRHQVVPLLEQRWSSLSKAVSRSARHCATSQALVLELAKSDFALLKTAQKQKINIPVLLKLDELRRINVLRYWIGEVRSGHAK